MSPFKLEPDSDFFGHIVTHDTEEQPGKLPRVIHTVHCNLCSKIEIHEDTPERIEDAFNNALRIHHIHVLAEHLRSTERAARYRDGGEVLGGG